MTPRGAAWAGIKIKERWGREDNEAGGVPARGVKDHIMIVRRIAGAIGPQVSGVSIGEGVYGRLWGGAGSYRHMATRIRSVFARWN